MNTSSSTVDMPDVQQLSEELLRAVDSVYWRLVPDWELSGRSGGELSAAVRSHAEFAARRMPGQLLLRVLADVPSTASHNHDDDAVTRSAIEIVCDDMPFLVDSVSSELVHMGAGVRLFIHPQIVVARDALGVLTAVHDDVELDDASSDQLVESWMHVEIDHQTDPAAISELQENLRRVLTDVAEAVEDWPKMRTIALSLADELMQADLPVPSKDVFDARALLQWLAEGHFTFLGYREYSIEYAETGSYLHAIPGTGLGILRSDNSTVRNLSELSPQVYRQLMEHRLLIITKANARATVHRPSYMDYISIKTFDTTGAVVGERRFLGLFSAAAYSESVRRLPVISRKVEEVIASAGLSLRSHSGKELLQILEAYPRDELFQMSTDELRQTVLTVLRLTGRRELRLFIRKDAYGRFISCSVYLPRDRYTTRTRLRMQELLTKALNGVGVDYSARVSEGQLARVRFVVRTDPASPVGEIDTPALQAQLSDITRLWEEEFSAALTTEFGGRQARHLQERYEAAFGDGYTSERSAQMAVSDVARLETLEEDDQIAVHIERSSSSQISRPEAAGGAETLRFVVYRRGEPMSLSAVLPVLQSLGVTVIDERPYRVNSNDGAPLWIYDFGLLLPSDVHVDEIQLPPQVRRAMENAFVACWRDVCEVDGFNELVLRAGLRWDQIMVLRGYAKYLRQIGTVYSEEYLQRTLVQYPHVATLLLALFEVSFNPACGSLDARSDALRQELIERTRKQLNVALEEVISLDSDRILRSFLTLITATRRTNFFQRGKDTPRKPYLAFKLDPAAIAGLPQPRPKFEIFVYSPRLEGVHLRFGKVARGGLRWSDRREDFRTEILGLVKAQMAKNAVIVPVGSKGGFVLKRPPKTTEGAAALRAEGVACYTWFICALLDVTDNRVDGVIVPPPDVVCHDDADSYLVVAADKGTATFSDVANGVAASYGFWLDDAFASGGSAGYDHKAMGITARGAWESVKQHFRGIGVDTQTQEFTVVGIGDMSGDVFGNGMLLSRHIRLLAAFDHRHIFVDPDPDATTSFAERQRLFDLPSSSWANYVPELISSGGGVFSREVKSIPISAQMRRSLGIGLSSSGTEITALSPPELIQAILLTPADLLFNGGIGTYVKAAGEPHSEAGDKSNDAVRVNGAELRVKVVAEGGNLGLTQRGRIEFAQRGGRIYTDAIDNVAGVNTSDHEVNIKILLSQATQAGVLQVSERNDLLACMTDEIAQLVLSDNYLQDHSLALSTYLSSRLINVHRRLMNSMELVSRLDRELEFLPSDAECARREAEGVGLTSPELSVLMAYVKIGVAEDVLPTSLPDEPWCNDILVRYFPTPLRERFAEQMAGHPLRREIVTTLLANQAVNRGGISFVYRAVEETGAEPADVLRAYHVVATVLGLRELWDEMHQLDNVISTSAQLAVVSRLRRVLDRGVRWLLQNRAGSIDVTAEIHRLGSGVAELLPGATELFVGSEATVIHGYVEELIEQGVPDNIARRCMGALCGFGLLDVVELATQTNEPVHSVAQVYFAASERFGMDALFDRVTQLPRRDRWSVLARMAMRYDLYAVLAGIVRQVLAGTATSLPPQERLQIWSQHNQVHIGRVQNTMAMLGDRTPADLATLSVLLRQLRTLIHSD
ncbi:MAG: NAD-glutamate dehydrogenase [Acidimicrobiales bacterium]|nr:MAG: NAD-glutamate dehydrogenase [Acidimicrobiales bacterium]